jgi:uncharacterized protein YqjF (DUF2071 family)
MTQRWNNLLFMHWPVQTGIVRALVPRSIDLDLHSGTAWVTITPFYLDHLRARWLPTMPWGSEFAELNVRTYVSIDGKPGVYFFSLDASSALAVMGARAMFNLPYFRAEMTAAARPDGAVDYQTRRIGAEARFEASYAPEGQATFAAPGSLDHWLTERYCLYAIDRSGDVLRTDIHHAPWPLQPAHVDVRYNSMLSAAGIEIPSIAPRLSFARRLDVVVWLPERVR